MTELYTTNTKISIQARGDGGEIFDYSLPIPHSYTRNGDFYTLEYIINGFFSTNKGIGYLNDILARFALSMDVKSINTKAISKSGYELKQFQGLKSLSRAKNYERVNVGQDNIFWAIKLHTEALIRDYKGEVPYCQIEKYAFDLFIDRAKDKSTLRAKCRSIWEWYNTKKWTIPKRKGLGMSRQEGAAKAREILAQETKNKVKKAIQGLLFMQEKVNIANVARDAKVSRNTAKKYLIELGYITK